MICTDQNNNRAAKKQFSYIQACKQQMQQLKPMLQNENAASMAHTAKNDVENDYQGTNFSYAARSGSFG